MHIALRFIDYFSVCYVYQQGYAAFSVAVIWLMPEL